MNHMDHYGFLLTKRNFFQQGFKINRQQQQTPKKQLHIEISSCNKLKITKNHSLHQQKKLQRGRITNLEEDFPTNSNSP